MKIFLLIASIVCLVACLISFIIAFFCRYAYYHTLDGSSGLYTRMHRGMIIFLIIGAVLLVLGVTGIIVRVVI